jgi:outer membrane protein
MKRLFVLVLSILLLSSFSTAAFAKSIAVVDLEKAMHDSKAGKHAKSEIQKLIEAKKVVIDRKVESLKKLANALQNSKLSKTAKDKKTAVYQDKAKELERYKNDAADEVRTKERELSTKVINDLINVIKKYAVSHKIDLVFEVHQGLIYWNDVLDITKDIIKKYDAQYAKSKK